MNTQERIEVERERAAALVRAFADARPAGEVPGLMRLAYTIESGGLLTPPQKTPRTCAECGHPEDDHPYEHTFRCGS